MTDINDWPENKAADPDCECCLGDGLQADGETPCPCIDARKANIAAQTITPAPQPEGEPVTLTYTNWRGETAQRTITPKRIWWGATDWHPEPQWLLTAFDAEKQADRDFALKDFGAATPQAAQEAAKPVMWRARHSETEEWQHFNRRPSWREVQPLYANPPKPSASVVEAMKHLHDIINCGNCSGSRQSARLALRALAGDGK